MTMLPVPVPETYSPSRARTLLVPLIAMVSLVVGMEFVTSYAVSIALPDLQGDLAASADEGSWVVTTYNTAFLIGLVLSNQLADEFGYRRCMILAVLLYAGAAIGCGLSHNLEQLLWWRAVMGLGGGTFLVRAQTAMNRTLEGKLRARAMLVFSLFTVGICRALAPAIGGYLTEWHSWRYVFFLNIPLALASLVLLVLYLPDLRARGGRRVDFLGAALLAGWVASLQILLSRGERLDWFADPHITALAATTAISFVLFLWWELRANNVDPILRLEVYRSRNFVVGSIYVVLLGMMLYGQTYYVPQLLRNIYQHSAASTGLLQSFNGAFFFVGLLVGAIATIKIGIRTSLFFGAMCFTVGMACWASRITPTLPDAQMYWPLALTGLGAGWQVVPLSTLINSQTPNRLMGDGMELYLCQRQLGGSWGIAVLNILLDHQRSFWSSRLGEGINDYSLDYQDSIPQGAATLHASGLSAGDAQGGAVGLLHSRLVLQSTINGYIDTYRYQVLLGIAAMGLIVMFRRGNKLVDVVRWVTSITR